MLDILIPGGGKDFLNPVGISEKIMQKHRERDTNPHKACYNSLLIEYCTFSDVSI